MELEQHAALGLGASCLTGNHGTCLRREGVRHLLHVRQGGRGQEILRLCSIVIGQALQATQEVRHVCPQGTHAQVHIGEHHVAQVLKKSPPSPMVRQDASVQHFRCGQHQTRHGLLDGAAFCARGIAIVNRHTQTVLRC